MTTSEVTQWIQRLEGMTAEEIAGLLRREKVTGRYSSAARCPIANFLRSKGAVADMAVYGGLVEWTELVVGPDGNPKVEHGSFLTPAGICEFVSRFDAGMFADLIEEPKSYPEVNINALLKELYADTKKSVKELVSAHS